MHDWPTDIPSAITLQHALRKQIVVADDFGTITTVAGVDAGFEDGQTIARAAVVVLAFPELKPLDYALARRPVEFPYVPGLLSFRETPVLLDALQQLRATPDLIICDGQGIAHPRRFGIACHLGLLTSIPTIGCAKSRLIGHHDQLPNERGARMPLLDNGEQIGVVLRTRTGVKPVYVSPGNRVGMEAAVQFTLACLTKYRLPETTRAAHNLASHGIPPIRDS